MIKDSQEPNEAIDEMDEGIRIELGSGRKPEVGVAGASLVSIGFVPPVYGDEDGVARTEDHLVPAQAREVASAGLLLALATSGRHLAQPLRRSLLDVRLIVVIQNPDGALVRLVHDERLGSNDLI